MPLLQQKGEAVTVYHDYFAYCLGGDGRTVDAGARHTASVCSKHWTEGGPASGSGLQAATAAGQATGAACKQSSRRARVK